MFKGWLRRWAGQPAEPELQAEGVPQPVAEGIDAQRDAAGSAAEAEPGATSEPAPAEASALNVATPEPAVEPAAAGGRSDPAVRPVLTIEDRSYAAESLGPESLELARLIQATDGLIQRQQEMLATLKRGRRAQGQQLQELLNQQQALPPLEGEGP